MMLSYPATSFGKIIVPHETLDIPRDTEILKSNFCGSGHKHLEYLFPINDLMY